MNPSNADQIWGILRRPFGAEATSWEATTKQLSTERSPTHRELGRGLPHGRVAE
jgi:hypothetical protein